MKNLLLSVLFLLPLVSLAGKTYTVTVVVKSLDGLTPLKDVSVQYTDSKGNMLFIELTDEDGKVVFSECTEKSFKLFCNPHDRNYQTYEHSIDNSTKWDIETQVLLPYEKEKELEFVASKIALPQIDTTGIVNDSCATLENADFPGGREALVLFLQRTIRIPAVAEELAIKGKVYLEFLILQDGSISAIHVKRGIPDCPECDAESIRVLAYMPNWTPATCEGKPVISLYTLPIVYHVQ
jgi:protein TonB